MNSARSLHLNWSGCTNRNPADQRCAGMVSIMPGSELPGTPGLKNPTNHTFFSGAFRSVHDTYAPPGKDLIEAGQLLD